MTKALTSKAVAARLSMRERVPLFSVVSNTDWRRAGITGETVTEMVVKHLIMRDAIGHQLRARRTMGDVCRNEHQPRTAACLRCWRANARDSAQADAALAGSG